MSSSRNSASGYDKFINVFSPQGRLFQIEYAFNAVQTAGTLSIAIRGTDSVVVACQKRLPDKLMDPEEYTNLYRINQSVGACLVGYPADCKHMALRLKYYAAEYKNAHGFEVSCDILCQKLATFNQGNTQVSGSRTLACAVILIGLDPEYGTMLYKTDPAGFMCGFRAVAIGTKERDANMILEKKLKKRLPSTRQETIELALLCLGQALGTDYRASEVEVAEVNFVNPKFHIIEEQEIDQILTAISERD